MFADARPRYGLSEEEISKVILPAPPKSAHATATVERQAQAGGFRPKGKGDVEAEETAARVSLMTVDPATLTAGQCISLLEMLHQRFVS